MLSFFRTIAIPALMGAAILASPLAAMAADNAASAPPETTPEAVAPKAPRETVEQRISNLHASLKITPGEEADWNGVTKAMRENAVVMEKLVREKFAKDPATITAVEELKTYERFARAHLDGLKNLNTSFARLYKTMPAAQKKVADHVFRNFGRDNPDANG